MNRAMPKFYAVAKGKEGAKLYRSWDECKNNVSRYPGAIHKSFNSLEQAETWLASALSIQALQPSGLAETSRAPEAHIGDSGARRFQVSTTPVQSVNAEAITSKICLSSEQTAVLQRVKQGQSTFFSGSAGTGKSVLLREIIHQLGGGPTPTVGITASTGIAAINIGGTTLHSWSGIGIGMEDAKKMAGMFRGQVKYARVLERWLSVQTLIIDEISMVDGALFDKLEQIARL
ncbi:PIF1-like helicase-domain-containing protein [Mycena rebaudengoi]|nr:PIF1-like helicase-domain-containing protein [Mycena rebaudengoi]